VHWHFCVALVVGARFVAAARAAPLTLAENGVARCTIVVAENAAPPERFAGAELQSYLEQICSAKFPISSKPNRDASIVVGTHDTTETTAVPSRYADDDAFRIRIDGSALIVKGATPRGTLFAVYALLERLGCHWFAPATAVLEGHHEWVPHIEKLALEPFDIIEQPAMRYRKRDADLGRRSHNIASWPALFAWMGKNRTNAFAISVDAYEKNRFQFRDECARRAMFLHVGQHSLVERFLPRTKYFAAHPEWFGMIDGKRTTRARNRPVMFETANAEAVHRFHENLIEYLRTRPEIDVLQLWPPDGTLWSESPESELRGTPAERMAELVQQTTVAVREAGLRPRVAFLAYSSFADPPRNMRFDPETLLEFCPINQNPRFTLADPRAETNAKYHAQLSRWLAQFPGAITHYSYYAKYSWRSLPVVLPAQIAAEIAEWRALGEVGTNLYCEPGNWLTLEANHLAFARASWDARFDAARWFDDYLRARFGAAAEPMKRFYAAATTISLDMLIPQSRTMKPDAGSPLLPEVRSALDDARQRAERADAKWVIAKVAWQADYLAHALSLRAAELAQDSKTEERVRAEIASLVAAHANDGTILDRGFGYRTSE
jgi:hypothetical protein